jgi:hypothetical protein
MHVGQAGTEAYLVERANLDVRRQLAHRVKAVNERLVGRM